MSDVTRILSAIEKGDPTAAGDLLPLVYDELRRLARQRLAREQPGQTLQATGLVHEAFLRLVDGESARRWDTRGHFFAAAAEAMRRILVDNARRKAAEKRGGRRERQDLDEVEIAAPAPVVDLLALDEALAKLEAHDPAKARLVKLRYFAGLSEEEAAKALGVSRATAHLGDHDPRLRVDPRLSRGHVLPDRGDRDGFCVTRGRGDLSDGTCAPLPGRLSEAVVASAHHPGALRPDRVYRLGCLCLLEHAALAKQRACQARKQRLLLGRERRAPHRYRPVLRDHLRDGDGTVPVSRRP
jgi:RNA polymerase sigma factor (TIGR02999 family)